MVKRHFAKEFGDLEWQEMPGIQFALVEGLDTNQLSWLRSFLFQLQSEEGENHEGDPECRIDM